MSDRHRNSHCVLFAVSVALAVGVAPRARAEPESLRVGADFQRSLQQPVGLAWSGVPLREALEALGREQNIAVMLDRRVDPGQPVNFSTQQQPLRSALAELADHMDLGVCYVGPVVYFGPPERTRRLPAAAAMRRADVQRLPSAARRRFAQTRSWSWPMLAVPGDLLEALARQADVAIVNRDRLPHDLWPAVSLPPLPLADRLTLLLAGFGLTYEIASDGSSIKLTPMPEEIPLAQRGSPSRQAASRGKPPRRPDAKTVYSLEVKDEPVGGVLKALTAQWGLQIEIDPRAEASLPTRITFHVKQASRDEVFKAVLQPAQLDYRLEDQTLHIFPTAP